MVDYGLLPPEINSGRIYAGPGSGPLLAAAAAWSGLAADLRGAASGHRSVISELTSGAWLGPSSAALVAAVTPFIAWLDSSAAEAEQTAGQSFAVAAAYEAAFAASIPPPAIAANRALLAVLVATNFLGQNTPAIAATEALYAEFWAQDAGAMYTYADSAAAATQLTELPEPADVADPYAASGFGNITQIASQVNPSVTELIKTLSTPLNGNGAAIDQWIVANTPLDDIVPLYSKYLSPYVNSIAAFEQATLGFANETAGFSALGSLAKDLAPVAQAAENAAQAAGASSVGTKVGNVTAGLARAVPLNGLSVPASWTSAGGPAPGPGATAIGNSTAIPAAAEGAVDGNTPIAPPFGQFFNAGNGRKTPAYGHRLTFMTRPPAAG